MSVLKRSTRNVIRNPIRLVLVIVLLGTSLMFVAAMTALSTSAQASVSEVFSHVGVEIRLVSTTGKELTDQQLATAEHTPGVVDYMEQIILTEKGEPALHGPAGANFVVFGLSKGTNILLKGVLASMTAGRSFTSSELNSDVALMSNAMAQANHLQPGSTFLLRGTSLTLIGLYTTHTMELDSSIVLPITTARRVLHTGVTSLVIEAGSSDQVQTLADNLRQRLGGQVDVAVSGEDQLQSILTALNVIRNNSLTALGAAMLSSVLLIVFTVFLTMRERTREIGVLKAIGASNWQVVSQFGLEMLNMSMIASVAATFLLLVAGPAIVNAMVTLPSSSGGLNQGLSPAAPSGSNPATAASVGRALTVTLSPQTLLVLFGVGIILAILASMIPAWYVARIKPTQVLHVV
jgi:putative ABC transport system permease protein